MTRPLPVRLRADIARHVADAPWLWADHVHHDREARRPVRLLANERYEVWVIGWVPGQAVELHDHGASAGALVVTEGQLVEITGRSRVRRRILGTGATRVMGAAHVHDVVNVGPGPATSIHVYSPPLRSMTFYDPVDGHPTRTETVAAEAPVLGLDPAPFLHPAGASRA
ncbi:MAG TPA: cysteine dioxygenase family protein [Acidimicrobiales bacterium]